MTWFERARDLLADAWFGPRKPAGKVYYRSVVEVEILSGEPWPGDRLEDLDAVNYETTEGMSVGSVRVRVCNQQVGELEMAHLLIAAGSEPGFLINQEDE